MAPPEPSPGRAPARGASDAAVPSIVDFRRTARRLRTAATVIGAAVLGAWVVLAVTTGASLALLAELAGLGVLAVLVAEVVVVGGSAVRGMLAAGERGDRLASGDVSFVPPQLLRRGRR